MKLIRGDRNRGRIALALVFAVQILASSLCISTSAQAMETISPEHCVTGMNHAEMQHGMESHSSDMGDHELPASACSHCSAPDDFTVVATDHVTDLNQPPITFLVAYLTTALIDSPFETTTPLFFEKAQSPPDSSSTLYTTTQRIRI